MTRNTGESPNAAVVSRLSQILEVTPQEKYSLSAKACQGILRRAERRGKDLPELLKTVLPGMKQQTFVAAAFSAGAGASAGSIGYGEEVSPTLAAAPSGTNQTPAVVALDMPHACDVIRDCGEIVPSLQARMATGGNQVPLTYQMQGFGDYREGDVASSCKQRDFKDGTDLVCAVDCRNFREGGETNGTLQAKESRGQSLNLNNTVRQNMVVRRLTPMECERLQGFPDGWTDIGEWRDSKGKLRKPSDSARYKALGNSIALPFWDFLAKRISAQYLRPVTMGSLFDGIGGFPLVFERHNGKGTARWASEIEEFPIAVTKLRFGED
jgi:DNA (cytosine-5)-methyltransferase 1